MEEVYYSMSRLLCLLIVLSVVAAPLRAQYVGFNQKEITEIQRMKAKSHSDDNPYDSIEKAAALALGEAPNPIDTIRTEGLLAGDTMYMTLSHC